MLSVRAGCTLQGAPARFFAYNFSLNFRFNHFVNPVGDVLAVLPTGSLLHTLPLTADVLSAPLKFVFHFQLNKLSWHSGCRAGLRGLSRVFQAYTMFLRLPVEPAGNDARN